MKFNRISLLLLILCLGILIGCGGSGGSGGNSGGSNSNVTPPISSTPSPGSPPSSPTPSPEPPSATLGIKILVPAYFYPTTNNQYWNQLATEAQKKADFIYAIVNVNNGPGNSKNSDYASAISNLHNKGGRILGYVYTSYGNRSQSDVQADIDRWFQWYGTNYIDGIFLDEQANSSGKEGYYKSIYISNQKNLLPWWLGIPEPILLNLT